MRLPTINLCELRKWKERNFQGRLEFIDWYAERLKKNENAKP